MKVLILSFSKLHDHEEACKTVKEHIENSTDNWAVKIVDIFQYCAPSITKLIDSRSKGFPSLFCTYSMSLSNDELERVDNDLYEILISALKDLADEFSPSIAVYTHPFYSKLLSSFKNRYKMDISTINITQALQYTLTVPVQK